MVVYLILLFGAILYLEIVECFGDGLGFVGVNSSENPLYSLQ